MLTIAGPAPGTNAAGPRVVHRVNHIGGGQRGGGRVAPTTTPQLRGCQHRGPVPAQTPPLAYVHGKQHTSPYANWRHEGSALFWSSSTNHNVVTRHSELCPPTQGLRRSCPNRNSLESPNHHNSTVSNGNMSTIVGPAPATNAAGAEHDAQGEPYRKWVEGWRMGRNNNHTTIAWLQNSKHKLTKYRKMKSHGL